MKIIDVVGDTSSTYKIEEFLKSAPSDEIFSEKELSEKFDISGSTIRNSRILKGYRVKFRNNTFYGSLSAITSLQLATADQDKINWEEELKLDTE